MTSWIIVDHLDREWDSNSYVVIAMKDHVIARIDRGEILESLKVEGGLESWRIREDGCLEGRYGDWEENANLFVVVPSPKSKKADLWMWVEVYQEIKEDNILDLLETANHLLWVYGEDK